MGRLQLSTRVVGDHVVIGIHGELDRDTKQKLDECLAEVLSAPSRRVIVDLSELSFMDTMSLSVITYYWKLATKSGSELVVAGAQYGAARVLWVTGMDSRLPLYASVDEALIDIATVSNGDLHDLSPGPAAAALETDERTN